MSPKWRYFLPGYLFASLHTLIGLLIVLLFYRPQKWRWSEGCIEVLAGDKDGDTRIWGKPAAQTHGFLIVYAEEWMMELKTLRAHERVHVVQGFLGGPLFMLSYGLCFAYFFTAQGFGDWYRAYRRNPFEVHAYGVQDRPGAWGTFTA